MLALVWAIGVSSLELRVHFPLAGVRTERYVAVTNDSTVFGVNFATCSRPVIGTVSGCPGGERVFNSTLAITREHYVGDDTWSLHLPLGDYAGPISVDLYAPQALDMKLIVDKTPPADGMYYVSTVPDCTRPEVWEMGGEFCQQQGNSWQLDVRGGGGGGGGSGGGGGDFAAQSLDMWPAFGLRPGATTTLLPNFRSAQLNNSRNVSVYVPSSVAQNTVPRPVGVMVLLDGSRHAVDSFAKNGGFESGQALGHVPESIMIGITTLDFVLQGDFEQRAFELTYAAQDADLSRTCKGTSRTGGTDLLLDWLEQDVIPAALAKLGMQRGGEVAIVGGSLGGLTSCYAASARPAVFRRALCFSPTNCFNFGSGGLAPVIASNFAAAGGALPAAVIQFMGAEGLVELFGPGNQTQWDFLVRDEMAWRAAGMHRDHMNLTGGGALVTREMYPHAQFGFETRAPVPEHAIMSLVVPGGQHAQMTWQREFAFALPFLYRPGQAHARSRSPIAESIRLLDVPAGAG